MNKFDWSELLWLLKSVWSVIAWSRKSCPQCSVPYVSVVLVPDNRGIYYIYRQQYQDYSYIYYVDYMKLSYFYHKIISSSYSAAWYIQYNWEKPIQMCLCQITILFIISPFYNWTNNASFNVLICTSCNYLLFPFHSIFKCYV